MSIFTKAGVAIITPFKEDDLSINYDAFAELIDFQIDNGTDCIIVCGSTGEAATMTEQEHLDVCKFCIDYTKKRVPVIAGSGSNCTQTAINLSKEIAGYGADGLLVIHPYYNKGTQKGLIKHFRMVAEEVNGCPVVLYNVPSRTGGNINPETVAQLVKEVPNIVGIKEASGNISQIADVAALTHGMIDIYSGNDDQIVPIMSLGGIGVISVLANVAPRQTHEICQKYLDGDVKESCRLQLEAMDLCHALFCEVNPIPVKKALELQGVCGGTLRLPLTELEPAHVERLKESMKKYGVL